MNRTEIGIIYKVGHVSEFECDLVQSFRNYF